MQQVRGLPLLIVIAERQICDQRAAMKNHPAVEGDPQ